MIDNKNAVVSKMKTVRAPENIVRVKQTLMHSTIKSVSSSVAWLKKIIDTEGCLERCETVSIQK
jgi:hypothetical protein